MGPAVQGNPLRYDNSGTARKIRYRVVRGPLCTARQALDALNTQLLAPIARCFYYLYTVRNITVSSDAERGYAVAVDLLTVLKTIRERHRKSQDVIAECMGISRDTYRHIEKRRRPLPDFRHGLIAWLRRFLKCADATEQEEREAISAASQEFVEQFADWLRDIEKQDHGKQGSKSRDKKAQQDK
jgi:transcriptional regulator with XRE-family HTH domain